MDKRAVISVTALLALGGAMGFFWRKTEQEPAMEPVPRASHPPTDMHAGGSAASGSAQMLEQQLQARLEGSHMRPHAAAPAGWSDPAKRAEARGQVEDMHPDLAAALQLGPEQTEEFLDLLARQQMDIAELLAARAGDIRDGVHSQRLSREIEVMELSGNAEQAAMLGEKYPDWVQHQQDEVLRNPVDQLQGMLVRRGIGMADPEFDPLVTALAAEQARLNKEMPPASEPGNSPRELLQEQLRYAANNRQLVRVASRFLNAQQLAAYEQLLEQRRLTTQRLLRTMGGETAE
jgi:hypothetical protein